MVARLRAAGVRSEAVLAAMQTVPRHLFVDAALHLRAYDDCPLPIGFAQTISQPYTVAKMTELLCGAQNIPRKVLEIGTGCGYQTAVLEKAGVREIYSVERIRGLYEKAQCNLRAAGCLRARLRCADGTAGLSAAAPFDGIIVTAAAREVPAEWVMQLAPGGRMVLPLDDGRRQYLWLIEKNDDGFREICVQEAHFVPLLGGIS